MTYNIEILPSGVCFQSEVNMLSDALAQSITLEHSCSNGSCGACKAVIQIGEIDQQDPFDILSEQEKSSGVFLTCMSKPLSDCAIKVSYIPELNGMICKVTPAKIDSISIQGDVAILVFRQPPNSNLNYLAGQYVDLIAGDVKRSYSIANSIKMNTNIELHIREVPNGAMSKKVFSEFKQNTMVRLEGPKGTFFVRNSKKPLIFLAGGTGFAPVKAMVEELLLNGDERQIHIYWGAEAISGFYSTVPTQWQQEHEHVSFSPILSGAEVDWVGRRGFVHQAILQDFECLAGFEVYACGSPLMIETAKKDLITLNLLEENFYSDAFVASTK
jgi:CDP-4-dehydro-6-deoxyglucose reductase